MAGYDKKLIRNSTAEFLIFTSQAGEQGIEARYEFETVWQAQRELMAISSRWACQSTISRCSTCSSTP